MLRYGVAVSSSEGSAVEAEFEVVGAEAVGEDDPAGWGGERARLGGGCDDVCGAVEEEDAEW